MQAGVYQNAYLKLARSYSLAPFAERPPPGEFPVVRGKFNNVVSIFQLKRDDGLLPVVPNPHALPGNVQEARCNYNGFHAVKVPYARGAGGAVLLLYPDGKVNSTGARSELCTALSAAWLRNMLFRAYGVTYSVQGAFVKTNTVVCAKLPWLISLDLLRKWKYTSNHAASVFPGVFVHISKISGQQADDEPGWRGAKEKQATVSILLYEWCVIISGMTDIEEADMLLVLLVPALEPFRKDGGAAGGVPKVRTQ